MKFRSMAFQFSSVFMIGLVVLLTAQSFLIVSRVKNYTKDDYSQFSSKIVEEDSSKISVWNNVLLNDLRLYSDSDVAKSGDNEAIIDWILSHDNIRNPLFNYILYCTPDGVGHSSDGSAFTVISKGFYREIMKNGKDSYVSNIDFQSDGSVCYYIARPVFNKANKKIGVVAGAVKLDEIEKMLRSLTMGSGSYSLLAGSDGVLITRPQDSDTYFDLFYSDKLGYKGFSQIASDVTAGNVGEGFVTDATGNEYFCSYSPVAGTPWSAIIMIPVTQIAHAGRLIGNIIVFINIIIGIIMVVFSGGFIVIALKPLKIVQGNIHEIADGDADLTKQINVKSRNEIGLLASGFNRFIQKLQSIVSGVKDTKADLSVVNESLQDSIQNNSDSITDIINDLKEIENQVQNQADSVSQTTSAVEQNSKHIETLESMIETQAAGVTQASAAVEEMIGNITSVNQSVGHMADSFKGLIAKTADGIELQKKVNEMIVQIEAQSKTLEDANKAISAIAAQTNMLAMNAAIESAHAGEAGRGFSVVADEIRKLSETSSGQSKTIRNELKKISESIASVVAAAEESTKSFSAMSEDINQTDTLVLQIKGAMDEQQEGSKQIVNVLKTMNDNTIDVRNASKEMTKGNQAILVEIENLRDATHTIRSSMDKISASADKIQETSSELSEISGTVHKSVDKIGSQIDLFKV